VRWAISNDAPHGDGLCNIAANTGHLAILQYLREIGLYWDKYVWNSPIQSGNMRMMEWCAANGALYDQESYAMACRIGDKRIMRWLEKRLSARLLSDV
jgi:hypothetical protein